MNFWDQTFSAPGYKYGTRPNAFLAAQRDRLAFGSRILVPGDGEGRNGVWLAQQGHDVTALDLSQVGLDKAQALARERGVALRTKLVDLADWEPEPASVDAVVLVFLHLPDEIRAKVHRSLLHALRPGGLLLLEAFTPQQLQHSSGGPKAADMLYTLDLLRRDFGPAAREVMAEEIETVLDEGPGHQGLAHVVHGVWIREAPID